MSGAIVAIIAATSGAAVAIAAAKKKRQEEEGMTNYNKSDMEGWEFKIIRSNSARFNNLDAVQQLCGEEALSGWEMVEKFDNYRIRFKRKTNRRSSDQFAEIDPYRTEVSSGLCKTKLGIMLGVVALTLGVGLFVMMSGTGGSSMPVIQILIGIAVLGAAAAVFARRKK